jgi:acyl phosphate:glycerol-3-phosphate acyltransferase
VNMSGIASSSTDVWAATRIIWVLLASYGLGCVSVGYYLVRWRTGQDLRTLGSGNLGAKNVKRVLGQWGFWITFIGDIAKGLIAVGIARWADLPVWAVAVSMLLVVAGHNWPVQLSFRGGKGVSTSIGAVLVYNWLALACLVVLSLLFFAVWRKVIWSGMAAYATTPFLLYVFDPSPAAVVGMFLLAAEVIFAHRQNLRDELLRLNPVDRQRPDNAL